MPIDQIGTAGIANGAVIPADLSTGAPTWDTAGYTSMSNTFGFKNRLINGAFGIDQRNAGALVNVAGGGASYTLDRWFAYRGGYVAGM